MRAVESEFVEMSSFNCDRSQCKSGLISVEWDVGI